MDLTDSPEHVTFRKEVRAWLKKNVPEWRKDRGGDALEYDDPKRIVRAKTWQRELYDAGYVAMGWPKAFGGQGADVMKQTIVNEELVRANAPTLIGMMGINMVGPTLISHGTDEQKKQYLPKILAAEELWCQGYSEPGSGSDLASLKTRAVIDGDHFVLNGQKIWTSGAQYADRMFCLVRTDPEAPKHKGISLFAVDMRTPGIRVDPMHLLSEHNINTTFYEGVRVPASALVGGENEGWKMITNQLNHERVTLCSSGLLERCFTDVRRWAQETPLADGRRVIDQEWVQVNLARVYTGLEFLRLINWKVAWASTQGRLDIADASTIKVWGTEWYLESFRLLMEILGPRGQLRRGSPEAVFGGHIENLYRSLIILTFGGGTNEIQRDLIGLFGLGLPRVPRM
jgi:alkylation response protein AidB-like acyl-CoA dehydrogenase